MNKERINQILLAAVLGTVVLFMLSGCGKSPRSKSVLCFLEESFIACQDKEIERMLPEPIPGQDGKDGADGADGKDGTDGQDGADGTQVEVVFPCGEDSVRHGEILLKIDGQFIAYFQNIIKQGQNVKDVEARLTVLEEGTLYMLTDGSQCKFSIVDGQVVTQ